MAALDCDRVRRILAGEREDDPSADEALALEAHLAACGACGNALAVAEADLQGFARSLFGAAPKVPDAAWGRVGLNVREAVRQNAPGSEDPFTTEAPAKPSEPAARPASAPRPAAPSPPELEPVADPLAWRRSVRAKRRLPGGGLLVLAAVAAVLFAISFLSRVSPPEPAHPAPTVTSVPGYKARVEQLKDANGKPFWLIINERFDSEESK